LLNFWPKSANLAQVGQLDFRADAFGRVADCSYAEAPRARAFRAYATLSLWVPVTRDHTERRISGIVLASPPGGPISRTAATTWASVRPGMRRQLEIASRLCLYAVTMSSAQAAKRTRKTLGWKRIVGYVISIAIVVAIFWWAIPKFADYRDVWAAIKSLTPIETWSLVAATIFNLVTYWWANQAALPGLGIGKAAVLTQTTTSVANTLPAGGAIAVGLTYEILDSWGFSGTSVALYVGVTGIWNIFTKLGLPMLALVFLALSGHLTTTYILAAIFGIIVLGVAVGLFALVFRSEAIAIQIGNWLGRVVSRFRRLVHKAPVTTWGDGAARFRRDTIVLVERRWLRLSLMTVLSQVVLFLVLLLSLRHLGVSEQEVSTAEAFAVYAFSRLLSAVPITPGGVGLIDLGYIGGLTAFSGEEKAAIVAAVLLFRALTYGIQIPIGGLTYVIWRVKSDWRRPADAAAQRERASYFALSNGSTRVTK
jgi:uncharacterized protein (TIRG00374 family)